MFSLSRQLSLATVTGMALLCLCAPVWAAEGRVQGIHYNANNRHFSIDAVGSLRATVNTLNIADHKRIIIDLDNAEIGTELPRDVQILHDLSRQLPNLKNVTVNQYTGNGHPIVRILMDIQGDPGTVRVVSNRGNRIELEFNDSANYTAHSGSSLAMPPSLAGLQQSGYPSQAQPPRPSSNASVSTPVPSQLQNEDLRRTLSILNRKYESLAQENQYLKARLSTDEQAQSSRQNDAQQDKTEQNRLKSEIGQLKIANQNLQSQLNGFLGDKNRPDPTVASKQAEINRLTSENRALSSRLNVALAAPKGPSVDEMKRTLVEMNRRYDSLAQETASLKNKLAVQSPVYQSASLEHAELIRQKAKNNDLETQVSRLKQDNSRIETLKSDLARLNESNTALEAENQRLTAQLANQNAKPAATVSDTDLSALRKQLTVAQSSLSESIRTINEQNKEIAFLRNQVADVKSGLEASSREQIENLSSQLATANRRLAEMQTGGSKVADNKSSLAELQKRDARIAELQAALNRAQSVPDESDKELKDQLNALQLENSRLKSAAQAGEAAKKELAAVTLDLQNLRKSAANAKGNAADKSLISQLTKEKQGLQAQVDSLQANQAQQNAGAAEIRALKTQLASVQTDLSSWQEKANQANREAAQLKQALQQAQSKVGASKPSANKGDSVYNSQIAGLNQQLAQLRKENANLRETQGVKAKPSSNAEAEQDYAAAKEALSAKKMDLALDKFKEAILLDPDNSRFAMDYSTALAEDHQYVEAIDSLRGYLQRNPGDRDAYNQLGKLYLLNDQPDAANQAFTRAISINTLNNYATSLKKLGKSSDAESVFKLALSLNPKDSEVLFNLGNLYNAENKLELARNKYLEALQIRPDFAEAHYNLGLIFSKLGDNTKAVSHLERFLQLSPNARNAETIRAYVQKLKA